MIVSRISISFMGVFSILVPLLPHIQTSMSSLVGTGRVALNQGGDLSQQLPSHLILSHRTSSVMNTRPGPPGTVLLDSQ